MLVPDGRVPVHMDYAMRLTGRAEPRICVLNTANGDDPQWALRMYDRFAGRPAPGPVRPDSRRYSVVSSPSATRRPCRNSWSASWRGNA